MEHYVNFLQKFGAVQSLNYAFYLSDYSRPYLTGIK